MFDKPNLDDGEWHLATGYDMQRALLVLLREHGGQVTFTTGQADAVMANRIALIKKTGEDEFLLTATSLGALPLHVAGELIQAMGMGTMAATEKGQDPDRQSTQAADPPAVPKMTGSNTVRPPDPRQLGR